MTFYEDKLPFLLSSLSISLNNSLLVGTGWESGFCAKQRPPHLVDLGPVGEVSVEPAGVAVLHELHGARLTLGSVGQNYSMIQSATESKGLGKRHI